MAERLFRGQIQPAARPLGSFLQPQQNNIAGAARPSLLPQTSQIATLQQAGTSSVAGFNQMAQLSDALKPFSAQLQKSVDRGLRQYAIGNIEAGYYDTLKNEEVKSKLKAQENLEEGAGQTADTITRIEAVDPLAGQLAREVNPWRAVGRNRALAQLAASQIGPLLTSELLKPGYAGIKPGSGQLAQAKEAVTRRLLNRFGLTGDEIEATYYVTPAINRGWDKFSQEQAKLYDSALTNSTTTLTSTSVSTFFDSIRQNKGLTVNGVFVPADSPKFAQIAGEQLTNRIDSGLALLGGKAKEEAWEQIQKTLGYWAGSGTNGALQIVQQVGVGPARDMRSGELIPYANRAKYYQAYPLQLTDNTTAALKARNDQNTQVQGTLETAARNDFFSPEGPMGVPFGSNEYQERYAAWASRWTRSGLQTANELGTKLSSEYGETTGVISAPTVEDSSGIITALNALRPSDIDSPEKVQGLIAQIDTFSRNTAGGDSAQYLKNREQLIKILEEKQKLYGGVAQNIGLQGNLTRYVNEDLADNEITGLLSSQAGWNPGLSPEDNIRNSTKLTTSQKQAYLNYGNQVRQLYQEEFDSLTTKWFEDNPNASIMPQGVGARLLNQAKNNVRGGETYKDLKAAAIAAGPPETTTKKGAPDRSNSARPDTPTAEPIRFTKSTSETATSQQAKAYTSEPVMDKAWVQAELDGIGKNGYASPEMNSLADKAGTSSLVFLRRQLDFLTETNPRQLQLLNQWKVYLDEKINRQSSSELPGQANYEYAMAPSAATYNPRAPGAWLMEALLPTELARLPNFEQGPSQGPNTPVRWYPTEGRNRGFFGPDKA